MLNVCAKIDLRLQILIIYSKIFKYTKPRVIHYVQRGVVVAVVDGCLSYRGHGAGGEFAGSTVILSVIFSYTHCNSIGYWLHFEWKGCKVYQSSFALMFFSFPQSLSNTKRKQHVNKEINSHVLKPTN